MYKRRAYKRNEISSTTISTMNENKIIPVPKGNKVAIDIIPKFENFDSINEKKLKRNWKQKAVEYRTLMIGNTIFKFSIIMIIILILLIVLRAHVIDEFSEIGDIEETDEISDTFSDPALRQFQQNGSLTSSRH